ncbi:hypothetical protein K466DRAFT_214958 [Polyporus arcularius HHB13444]|uniref:BTB domain-containing protein n=1 Tax=Polyporus arcularius HHB13444 TaxID=1314778 RepID=A0A5C3PFP9_9APHY|nr:hypothetical protein K466DRAFT_214958 [Polyporus arcularius HHB13444]
MLYANPSQLDDSDYNMGFTAATPLGTNTAVQGPMATHAPHASAPLLASSPELDSRPAAFGPLFLYKGALPDILFTTADNVSFYAHRHILQHASTNAFAGLLTGTGQSLNVLESSVVLSIALYVVYALPCDHLSATLATVEAAADALVKYGVPLQSFAAPNSAFYHLVLVQAPYRPIDAYALAAHYGLETLAVAISAHLLAYDLSTITNELAAKMGSIYVKRLFDLHKLRRSALKNIVMNPPAMHIPNLACGTGEQRQLTQAWALAAAEMAWNALPSESTLQTETLP